MDDLINQFVNATYALEGQEDVYQALGLFRTFNYHDPFPRIEEMIMMESYEETATMADMMTLIILQGQAYILDRHGISLTEETTLAHNNEVLRVLFQLQRLETPEPVIRILESQESPEIQYSEIMEMFTSTPAHVFLQTIETLRPVFLKNLANYLYEEESNAKEAVKEIPVIKTNVRAFKDVFGINPAVRTILDVGTTMGEPFELMLPLFNELREIIEDENTLVETLFFILMISSDGTEKPMEVYEAYADHLVTDITARNRLGRTIGEMYNKLNRFKENQVVTK